MSYFKFTNINGKVIHTSSDLSFINVLEEGSWSPMTDEEYSEYLSEFENQSQDNLAVEEIVLTAEQKLKNAGLTIDELKELLGL